MNQDTILFLAVGDTLIVNQNDAPLMGEGPFIKKMVSKFKNSYLLALCSNNADMINFVDEHGSSIAGHPAARKRGAIMEISKRCQYL
jgi:hypothetical protein